MNSKEHKFVRFEDWHLERPLSSEKEASSDDGRNPRRATPSVKAVLRSTQSGLERYHHVPASFMYFTSSFSSAQGLLAHLLAYLGGVVAAKDLRDIRRHLCLALLKRVPMFEKTREGDPIDEMLFIMRENLATMTTNGGRTGFFNTADLKAGDFCGEELLTWALVPNSSANLPTSTRTVEAKTEVEAFALMADDLKFVASQFRRLHSKQLRHTFRFYSLQCRTWSACFIQAAWRRHWKRKLEKSLREEEDRLQDALTRDAGTLPSLLAAVYASKFAANALRGLQQKVKRDTRPSPTLLPLLPQKPAEPDFTAEHH